MQRVEAFWRLTGHLHSLTGVEIQFRDATIDKRDVETKPHVREENNADLKSSNINKKETS